MTVVIRARGLAKRLATRRGTIEVFRDIDLDVVAGQVTALVAPSLAGKTTFVNVLAGWEPPDDGELVWAAGPHPSWRDVAVVPQGFALLDELSVEENILLPRRTGAVSAEPTRLEEVCAAVGIAHLRDRNAAEISVGERQRTMVARALLGRPPCLLADEPTAHQDDRNARAVLGLFREAAADGAAVLIATRNPDVVDGVADVVVELPAPR